MSLPVRRVYHRVQLRLRQCDVGHEVAAYDRVEGAGSELGNGEADADVAGGDAELHTNKQKRRQNKEEENNNKKEQKHKKGKTKYIYGTKDDM